MHWMRKRRRGTTDEPPPRGRSAEYLDSIRPPTKVNECGHPDRKHRANGMCASCYQVAWMKANPEGNTGNNWSRNNPERRKVLTRRASLKQRHGITVEDFESMWAAQQGECANPRCDTTFPLVMDDYRRGLQVDHDHRTGKIRSLLCGRCNKALGDIDDDTERLAGLIEYLRSHCLGGEGGRDEDDRAALASPGLVLAGRWPRSRMP